MVMSGAEEFHIKSGPKACILVHGLSSSPSEMRPLGDYLAEKGYTVTAPLLPGHGTSHHNLADVNWQQWYDTLEETVEKTLKTHSEIYLIGLSMGACLSIYGAAVGLPVKGVVSLAAPIYLRDRRSCFAPILKYFMPFISKNGLFKKKRRKVHEQTNIKYKRVAYEYQSLNGVNNLLKLIKNVKNELKNLKTPIMVVQSEDDSAVLSKSAEYIYDMAGSKKKHILYLKKSGHIVTMGEENALMFEEIYKFIRGI